ncbi:glycosyltransferase [Sphingomonas sp.]|uniref:glycosyltransferase n=1 Tax=Sphingomonas sp. TaxID=28214 RepID=UPI0025E78CDC|nr:glycosyltransferase [Sphingomonas sp.]MBV9527845.1 glycosyltransferase [Sphingomonas sp.]
MTLQGDQRPGLAFEADGDNYSGGQFNSPDTAILGRVRDLIGDKAFDTAAALLQTWDFAGAPDDPRLADMAELLYDARDHGRADALFSRLIRAEPRRRDLRVSYGKRLFDDGRLVRAWQVLAPVRDAFADDAKSQALADGAANLLGLLTSLEGRPLTIEDDSRILAMKHAILRFQDRTIRSVASPGMGRLTLITGGLGPGGAERQLTRLAVELERARKELGSVGGIALQRPVEVLVRSHSPERQTDFYLGDLRDEGVELNQINDFQPVAHRTLGIDDPVLLQLLTHLPPSVNYGVRRLTPHFVESGTDTASVWQDGACLFAGLAALIAGVPQIQLAIRGLPPSVRRHMYRPEYEVFYRAMAEIPGVVFVSNNVAAAKAYAQWLDVDLDRFAIVYNGVEPMSSAGSSSCHALWEEFNARTAGCGQTIGGVFRFDTDKQPLTWVRFAARYLKRHADARFILVGGGRLLEHAIKLAEDYGIDERILFVGRSTHVGYWMTKMDALVLLSRYEGLPNVLIEAQYMGVPVVTTPAGGAAECLIDGTSGHVLNTADKPDLMTVVERAHDLVTRDYGGGAFEDGGHIRTFLDNHFSIEHMLEQFVSCTASGLAAPAADGGDELWEEAA